MVHRQGLHPDRTASATPPTPFSTPSPGRNSLIPQAAFRFARQSSRVAEAAVSLRALRREIMAANGWSLRDLYRTLETPGANRLRDAHAALDSAVRAAYGMKATEDTLAFLLRLNLDLAAKESKGNLITAPGLPQLVATPNTFASEDCVQPPAPGFVP